MADSPVRTIILEDNNESRHLLEKMLSFFISIQVVGSYSSADDALKEIVRVNPDLVFLDVEMPGKSGFDFLTEIKTLNLSPCVIFTTAFDHFAIPAIKAAAFDFILKPVSQEELAVVINRYLSEYCQIEKETTEDKLNKLLSYLNPHNKIRFNTRQGFVQIDPDEIIYCQADWNYSELFLGNKKKEIVTMHLGKVEPLLPPELFVRINRSVIINRNYLDKYARKTRIVTLRKGDEVFEFKVSGGVGKKL